MARETQGQRAGKGGLCRSTDGRATRGRQQQVKASEGKWWAGTRQLGHVLGTCGIDLDEESLTRARVRVVVQMRRVAVGRTAGAYIHAMGIRCRKEWVRVDTQPAGLGAGGDHRQTGTCRWTGGGTGGGTRGAGGMD